MPLLDVAPVTSGTPAGSRKLGLVKVDLKPETERLIQEEINNGNFQSIDEFLTHAIYVMREREEFVAANPRKNFSQFLMESPLRGSGLDLDRPKSFPRPIDL